MSLEQVIATVHPEDREGLAADITAVDPERDRAIAMRHALNDRLEQRVSRRTFELHVEVAGTEGLWPAR